MRVASAHKVKTLAFPSISTGIFGYPVEQAAVIATGTVRAHATSFGLEAVVFACFSSQDLAVYGHLLAASGA